MSTETPSVRRHDDLRIPVDGETVGATRHEPTDVDGPAPTLLMYLPYRHRDYSFAGYKPLSTYFARHGYEVVVADVVGTGASSGRKPEPFSADEGPQAAAIVEWLADQPWSTGRIGMYGISYGGETALRAAAEAPDPLEAIVPIHATHTMYRAHSHGGSAELYRMGGRWGPNMQALQALPPTHRDPDGRWADVWRDHLDELEAGEPWLFQLLAHDTNDDYWREKDIPVDGIDTPTLAAGGWRDLFTTATLEYFEALDGPKRLLLGPWRHNFPYLGRESAVDFRRQAVEWFDRFLRDADDGDDDGAPIAYWTERNGGGTVGGGVWRERDDWPAVGADDCDAGATETMTFALAPDGLVAADAPDARVKREYEFEGAVEREYEFDHTVGIDSAETVLQKVVAPPDTNADDARSLTFETDPLDEPLELTGTGRVRLRLTATTPDPNLSVRLVDVAPDGEAHLVTHRELRASRRESDADPEPLTPGEEYALDLSLRPNSHLFEAGHRLRLSVSAGLFPGMFPPREHGSFTVRSSPDDPSTMTLPGRRHPGGASFDDAVEMAVPDDAVPVASPWYRRQDETWTNSRDHVEDTATVRVESSRDVALPHVEGYTATQEIEATVAADDPTSLVLRQSSEHAVEYATETVRVEVDSRVTHDVLQIETRVTADGETLFEQTRTTTDY